MLPFLLLNFDWQKHGNLLDLGMQHERQSCSLELTGMPMLTFFSKIKMRKDENLAYDVKHRGKGRHFCAAPVNLHPFVEVHCCKYLVKQGWQEQTNWSPYLYRDHFIVKPSVQFVVLLLIEHLNCFFLSGIRLPLIYSRINGWRPRWKIKTMDYQAKNSHDRTTFLSCACPITFEQQLTNPNTWVMH